MFGTRVDCSQTDLDSVCVVSVWLVCESYRESNNKTNACSSTVPVLASSFCCLLKSEECPGEQASEQQQEGVYVCEREKERTIRQANRK